MIFLVGRDAVAAVHDAAAVGLLHVLGIDLAVFAAQIFEQTLVLIIALDEAAAGRVVFGDGQQQRAIAGEREGRLHQALAESAFAEHPGAIMILQSAGQNLGGGGSAAIDQHNDRIFLAALAMLGDEFGFSRRRAHDAKR